MDYVRFDFPIQYITFLYENYDHFLLRKFAVLNIMFPYVKLE